MAKDSTATPAPQGGGRFDGLRELIDGFRASLGMAPAKNFTMSEKAVAMGTFGAMASVDSSVVVEFDTKAGEAIMSAREETSRALTEANQVTERARIEAEHNVKQAQLSAGHTPTGS